MRHHEFTIELPHSARRLWAWFQSYHLWKDGGYDYVMLRGGLSGSVSLEPVGVNRTRLRFRESFHIDNPVLRWFEGPIYRFINKKNEESMRGAADWLAKHPEFRADLMEPET